MNVGVLVGILGLALLILAHEAGHFFVARAIGMRPRKFYLGFPPALAKITRGGVEYGIGMIPLGGYVKLPGMYRPVPGDLRATISPERAEQLREPLDALDAAIAAGDDAEALTALRRLEPEIGQHRVVEEIRDGLAPDAYWRQRTWKRLAVIGAGPLTNIVLAGVLLTAAFSGANGYRLTRGVDSLQPGSPAQKAGLMAGDQIEAVAGRAVRANGIRHAIESTRGRPFTLAVERDGREVTIGPLRARREAGTWKIGYLIDAVPGPGLALPRAASEAVAQLGSATWGTLSLIGGLIRGRDTHDLSGTVGMVQASAAAYHVSKWSFVQIVGLISLALGLCNLLPLLPLDGGHIVMSLLEGVRRRAFSQLVYLRYSAVGLVLILMLSYIGLRNSTGI